MERPTTNHLDRRKQCLIELLDAHVKAGSLDTSETVFVLGASVGDLRALRAVGFSDIVLSNIRSDDEREPGSRFVIADAEDLALPDQCCDILAAFEVLHHCRSPHRVLCEMLRAARRHVIMLEPHESLMMRAFVRLGFSFPYELLSVAGNRPGRGGLRNMGLPNFIYRWSEREVQKTVSSFLPEFCFEIHARSYWDFPVEAEGLKNRLGTRIPWLSRHIGAENLVHGLQFGQRVLNQPPWVRHQGNKFFCLITKRGVQPWLRIEGQSVLFNKSLVHSMKELERPRS